LVLPSFAEGLPVVFMESLALGRPVIATQIAGHPELLDERVGWLVPPADSLALAAAMASALESTDLAEMGCEGRRRVEKMHDAKKEATRLLRLMTAAVKQDSVPPWAPELDETYAIFETAPNSETTPSLAQDQSERASVRF
jgi:colanic acid/amylovoran biosynthesis glycosyltransferase